jgi:hypothetical protein
MSPESHDKLIYAPKQVPITYAQASLTLTDVGQDSAT